MEEVTAGQVKQAVQERGIQVWKLRTCSICGTWLHYHFLANHVEFDSNCDCVSYWIPPRPDSYEAIADLLNRQTPEIRLKIWNDMLGITTPEA